MNTKSQEGQVNYETTTPIPFRNRILDGHKKIVLYVRPGHDPAEWWGAAPIREQVLCPNCRINGVT